MEAITTDSNGAPMPEDGDDSDSGMSRDSASFDTLDEMPNQHYNVRIRSHRFREYHFNDEEKDYEDDEKFKPSLGNKEEKHHYSDDNNLDERKGLKKSSQSLITAKDRENLERKKMLENSDLNFGKSQFKVQQEYFDKLSTIQKVPTLPDGVTLRDDPMKKTNAFLTSGPKLE